MCSFVFLYEEQREWTLSIECLKDKIPELHAPVQKTLQPSRDSMENSRLRGSLSKFVEGGSVLATLDDFAAGENLSLR